CSICLHIPLPPLLLLFSSHAAPTIAFFTLSLHDALPISFFRTPRTAPLPRPRFRIDPVHGSSAPRSGRGDRGRSRRRHCKSNSRSKSTRLNSSHRTISYAVFCLKKKKKKKKTQTNTH